MVNSQRGTLRGRDRFHPGWPGNTWDLRVSENEGCLTQRAPGAPRRDFKKEDQS
jgi:hypothetical protein